MGYPSRQASSFRTWRACTARMAAGSPAGLSRPDRNTGVAFTLTPVANDYKPTFNTNLTWVKGNHTWKLGATALFEGIQSVNDSRADGQFTFSAQQTSAILGQNGPALCQFGEQRIRVRQLLPRRYQRRFNRRARRCAVGNALLWFLSPGQLEGLSQADLRLRPANYDYASLWREQYGRMQNAAFNQPNSLIGGRLGTVEYSGDLQLRVLHTIPLCLRAAPGSRVSDRFENGFPRGRSHIAYATTSDQAGLEQRAGDFYTIPAPAYGASAGQLMYARIRLDRGTTTETLWCTGRISAPNFPVPAAPGVIPPASPFVSIAPNTGRLPRTFQWSLGFQREITRNLAVDAAYVGNRGVWWAGALTGGSELATPGHTSVPAIGVRPQRPKHRGHQPSQLANQFAERDPAIPSAWPIPTACIRDSQIRKLCFRPRGPIRNGTASRLSLGLQMEAPGTIRCRSK